MDLQACALQFNSDAYAVQYPVMKHRNFQDKKCLHVKQIILYISHFVTEANPEGNGHLVLVDSNVYVK